MDSVLGSMSIEERIGQLFMVAAYSNKDVKHEQALSKLVEEQHIGGLIFFQGGPMRQAHLCNRLQQKAKVPLLIGIDGEWGLSMRLDSTMRFPYQMALGAVQNDSLVYAMGAEIARQSRRLGIHVNFAPVADVNNNPRNPVINYRSFGEDKEVVARRSIAYMRGMQDNGVLANAKHFPGHGDTDTDSHHALPLIRHSRERIDEVELYPFRQMMEWGLASVMVAHLNIPALDDSPNLASTLSPRIVNDLLIEEMGFQGLIFTDALNMKGVSKYFKPGEVDLMALLAGNDVLLFPEDVPKAANMILQAIEDGRLSEERLNRSVRKILQSKAWAGLHREHLVPVRRLIEDLNTPHAMHLKRKLSEAAITVLKNDGNLLPLKSLDGSGITVLSIGGPGQTFKNTLSAYCKFDKLTCSSAPGLAEGKKIRDAIPAGSRVVICIEGTNNYPGRNFGLSQEAITLIEHLASNHPTALVHLGNPYALARLSKVELIETIVVAYQDDSYMARAAAEVLGGALPARGKLPVAIGSHFAAGAGIEEQGLGRLYRGSPLDMGLRPEIFRKVDSIAIDGIQKKAYPGCQILLAKDGKVIYEKAFGFHTYEDDRPVRLDDLYDLASITKIAASTISLMHLQDRGRFSLDARLGEYFPEISSDHPYASIPLRRMMAHQAGLKAWIPFYKSTLVKGQPRWDAYAASQGGDYQLQLARGMYIHQAISDSLIPRILDTPLNVKKDYKYSDLGYFFVKEIVGRQGEQPLERYVSDHFYKPLGLQQMGYLPLERIDPERITPTEYDKDFRKQVLRGYVHDPGAAMQGGVGGHAGLFSNAYDLAVLMQMLLNKGEYGGRRYLSEAVVEEYVKCQFCKDERDENRRGAGFDKPVIPDGPGPTCKCVDFQSFGHTGFTGTIAWADPVENIVFVFLSNRVYPTAENNRLAKLNIRTKIQEEFYKALSSPEEHSYSLHP